MSVAAIPSPASSSLRAKRLYDGDSDTEALLDSRHPKRTRTLQSSPHAGRCGLPYAVEPSIGTHNVLAALLVLFPGMDPKVVEEVLVSCNNSIDAAIKRLTDLRLSADDATVAAATAAASSTPLPEEPAQCPPQPEEPAVAPNPGEPQTADQWIDFLVTEMLASKDLTDARSRAAVVLQHFERFVKQRHKGEVDAKLGEALKENAIYKRAVQIQASRMASKAGQEEELGQLRHMLAQYQEQCRKLELHAYSLAMHLQQATNGNGSLPHQRNPDVY